jgi:hypothetical protein
MPPALETSLKIKKDGSRRTEVRLRPAVILNKNHKNNAPVAGALLRLDARLARAFLFLRCR